METNETRKKQIGDLNGLWALLLKLLLATYPVVLAWTVWVTSETFKNQAFRSAGDRFTLPMAADLEKRINEKFATLPPQDWRNKINDIAADVRTLQAAVQNNALALTRIEMRWDEYDRSVRK
jgi:hypothetical protein